ncbi:hypothetical protein [Inediibacterium massiliense]|uniref:hypothetical protein n=1 Tax=Inediibacterium massiliense TaxID=1658111 RepID=UPI0006B505DB|nr:hypothetical protein [Inediibacterium massiliense]
MLTESNREKCIGIIRSAIKYCNDNLYRYKGKKIDIVFEIDESPIIGNMPFKACCKPVDDGYKIIIDAKLFERTFEVLNALLAKENNSFYMMLSGEYDYNNEKANLYLDILYEIAVKLVIFHELGHIYNGHLDYKNSRNYSAETSMFMSSECNKLPPIESQVLEMDADAFAATLGIGQITFDNNIKNFNNIIKGIIKDKKHALVLFIIGSNIIFSLQGLGRKKKIKDIKGLKYLPLRARQDCYVKSSLNAFTYLNPKETLIFGQQILNIAFFREVLPNIEQYTNLFFREAYGFSYDHYDMSNNKNELGRDILNHCDYLNEFWLKDMRDKLKPYAYFELAK